MLEAIFFIIVNAEFPNSFSLLAFHINRTFKSWGKSL